MNTKVIAIVVGVLVLVGGGAYLMASDNDEANTNNQTSQTGTNETVAKTDEETATTGNLQTLRGSGKAQECSFSYSDDAGSGVGKMYTDGEGRGRLQIDLTTARGNAGESNTLITAEKVYSWTKTEGGSFGFVADANTVQPGATTSPTTSSSQTAGKDFDLKCKDWTVDEAVLTVPTDVNFTALPAGQ